MNEDDYEQRRLRRDSIQRKLTEEGNVMAKLSHEDLRRGAVMSLVCTSKIKEHQASRKEIDEKLQAARSTQRARAGEIAETLGDGMHVLLLPEKATLFIRVYNGQWEDMGPCNVVDLR